MKKLPTRKPSFQKARLEARRLSRIWIFVPTTVRSDCNRSVTGVFFILQVAGSFLHTVFFVLQAAGRFSHTVFSFLQAAGRIFRGVFLFLQPAGTKIHLKHSPSIPRIVILFANTRQTSLTPNRWIYNELFLLRITSSIGKFCAKPRLSSLLFNIF